MVRQIFGWLLAATVMLGAHTVLADVKPLGFVIGKATLDDIQNGMRPNTSIIDTGTNKFTEGPMVTATGTGFGIEGLESVIFIFTKEKLLDAVLMTIQRGDAMSNERFNKILGFLEAQYKVTSKNIPFVGNREVKLRKDKVNITLESPHMDFNMYVLYATDDFAKKRADIEKRDADNAKAQESQQF